MRTQEAVERFCASRVLRWNSPRTEEIYRTVLSRFAEVYEQLPTEPEAIEAFLARSGLAPASRNTYFRVLKTFYRFVEQRLRLPNPTRHVAAPPFVRPRPRILTPAQLHQLLMHPGHPPHVRALLYLLADTGIRIGEAASLTVEDVGEDSIVVRGKTGEREVPCSPAVCGMLKGLVPEGRVFPYTVDWLKHAVRKAFRRAGLSGSKLGPHTLRHTFATLWDGSERVLQGILGHKTPSMTFWYRQWRLESAKEEHARHSPLKRALEMEGPRQLSLF